jgi:8-oxo-dGTP pyrophosphatase MutT (NUDIX family)
MSFAALERLRQRLRPLDDATGQEEQLRAEYPEARLGAVLALFYPCRDEPYLVLTQRTPHLREHSGQISFPGGRIDPYDFSPIEAALRETREELGIGTDHLTLLGGLDPIFVLASNYLIFPFVALAQGQPAFAPNPAEVAEVIELPFRVLLQAATVEEEIWIIREERRRVSFYRYRDYNIWGATARMLRQVVELAGGQPPPAELLAPGDTEPA